MLLYLNVLVATKLYDLPPSRVVDFMKVLPTKEIEELKKNLSILVARY